MNDDLKITPELNDSNEEEAENDILDFVHYIVNGYCQNRKEYLKFLSSEAVDVGELLSALNKARLMRKLCACSNEIIKAYNIEPNSEEYTPLTADELTEHIVNLAAKIKSTLDRLQIIYNNLYNIDDEEEYNKFQREIRGKRNKFRQYSVILKNLHDTVNGFVEITAQSSPVGLKTLEITLPAKSELVGAKHELNSNTHYNPQLSEQAFFDWLISDGNISDSTARSCLYDIHSIEKIYQKLFGVRRNIYGAASIDDVKSIIENLINKAEYIDMNNQRHGRYTASLKKFAQFAGASADRVNNSKSLQQYQIKTVDFNNPYAYVKCKPLSFTLNNKKYIVESWRELYLKFLNLLYNDNKYTETLKSLIGKSLYGNRTDFADKANSQKLRVKVEAADDFFAEGNLNAPDLIKHIKCLLELCSIDSDKMIIEYVVRNYSAKNNDDVERETSFDSQSKPQNPPIIEQVGNDTALNNTAFAPDASKPFVLKDAIAEILSSNSPDIAEYREYQNGISPKNLVVLIEKYYGKSISQFEVSTLLMSDNEFKYVEKGCFVLRDTAVSDAKQNEEKSAVISKGDNVIVSEEKAENDNYVFIGKTSAEDVENNSDKSEIETADVVSNGKANRVIIKLDGNEITAYDYSDALNKACEFSISCKPFEMARISQRDIKLNGKDVFFRRANPVDGYSKLSNGLQLIEVNSLSDLQTITAEVRKFCRIPDDMITIIS